MHRNTNTTKTPRNREMLKQDTDLPHVSMRIEMDKAKKKKQHIGNETLKTGGVNTAS
jgi:hypothetical protein